AEWRPRRQRSEVLAEWRKESMESGSVETPATPAAKSPPGGRGPQGLLLRCGPQLWPGVLNLYECVACRETPPRDPKTRSAFAPCPGPALPGRTVPLDSRGARACRRIWFSIGLKQR